MKTASKRAVNGAQHKESMRASMLVTAKRLFVANGYDNTTMREIVKQAGTSIGNCYFYFSDKAAILLAIIEEIVIEIAAEVEAIGGQYPTGSTRMAVCVYCGVQALLKRKDIARVAAVEAKHPAARSNVQKFFIARILSDLEAAPEQLRGGSAEMAAYAWQGAIFNVLEGLVTGELKGDADSVGRFLARWNLQALGYSSRAITKAMAEIDKIGGVAQKKGRSKKL